MPKKKKSGSRGDKEKPLLTVQGVLRLEKSFVKTRHDDAEVIKVVTKDEESKETKEIKLAPTGASEHDLVKYKSGYELGPGNPFPTNEPEKVIYEAQRKLEEKQEAFDALKQQSEAEKKERELKFRKENLIPENELKPPGEDEEDVSSKEIEKDPEPEEVDPDNPENYILPMEIQQSDVPPAEDTDDLYENIEFSHKVSMDPSNENSQQGSSEPSNGNSQQVSNEPLNEDSQQGSKEPSNENSQEAFILNDSQKELLPGLKPMPDEQDYGKDMVLSVALEMEENRRKRKKEKKEAQKDVPEEEDENIYSLDELTRMKTVEQEKAMQGPEINQEEILKAKANEDAKALLEAYWQFVKDNPQDFTGWTYLLQHVENIDIVDEIRTAYNAFLPLYPYCFAYWIRYSEIEKKHEHWQRSLAILHRGLEAIPMSVDLWVSYLDLYHKIYKSTEDFDRLFREQCERGIMTVGLDFKSDLLWERYLEWELERKNLEYVTEIYARLVRIPTKLYNKHWDNFIAHVRDHHPRDILSYEDYDQLRRVTCKELGLTYRPDPVVEPHKVREVFLPEDKLKAGMKERIVASLVNAHETTEQDVEKRLKFESKIKRPYFHVKPLDLRQLKNWDAYLEFEIAGDNHERIVVLFERCLIPCAKYEQFWAKYAQYLEDHHKRDKTNKPKPRPTIDPENQSHIIRKARWSFGTGLTNVDDLRERKCMWTLRGWKETDKDGNEIMVAEEIPKPVSKDVKTKDNEANDKESGDKEPDDCEPNQNLKPSEENEKNTDEKNVEDEMSSVCKTTWSNLEGQEAVRNVYKRGCYIHCPQKALIHLKFATFEESCENNMAAKEVLYTLLQKFPLLIEASMHLIDLERRSGSFDAVVDLYKKLMKKIPQNRKSLKTWIAMKMARFQFKVANEPDKALATLRVAMKKDKSDPRLYTQIIDICYQRTPADINGVTASIELALKSSDLNNMQKLTFVKRKLEMMQEFGDINRYREACEQLKTYKKLCASDLKVEAKKRKELEREEMRLKELEELRAQTRANANLKAKMAEAEGKLLCTQCQAAMYPNAEGFYEFEGFHVPRHDPELCANGREESAKKAAVEEDEDGIVDLLDMEIPEDQEEIIKKTLEEKTKYKEVAPTWELNIETYGYGKRRKVYDPDYEHVEASKFKEYERLETDGYDESIKDKDRDKIKRLHAPGLGSAPRHLKEYNEEEIKAKYTTSDYVVPPKVPQLQLGPGIGPKRPYQKDANDEVAEGQEAFELPPELVNPQKAPCVNVPEWFVKEGGELCLSDTKNGLSILRYWPKFLSEKGNALMFKRLRKYCKWHQKQIKIGGEWKYETRLVAWYGPCDYVYSGLELKKNLNWAPELLDLLHRLIGMTRHDFNSCFCNLYRHGHDMCGWHSDVHPQLGRNPPVASVSLGAVRVFEFRRKNGPANFIRFPLFPGSLLVMEGATQEDWLHCLPRDPNCKEERVNLTFRIMYAMNKRN